MAQVIQIKRRVPGTGKPASGTGAGQVTAGELAASISAVAATGVAELYIGDGSFVHDLVTSARQVEIAGPQTITGAKTIAVTNLHITGGADGDLLSTDGAGVLEWIEPPKGVDAGTTAPAAPNATGDLWYNTTTHKLMIWNGSTWQVVNGVEIATTAPTGRPTGSLWLNSNTHVLSVYNGTAWDASTGNRSFYDATAPAGMHVAGDIWWSPAGPQYHNGTTWVTATLPGFAGVATDPPISGNGTTTTPLGVTMATTAQIDGGAETVHPISSAGLRSQIIGGVNGVASLTTTNKLVVPAINELDTDIGTLSGQIAALSGALRMVGTYDADVHQVVTADAATLTVGANLPAAAAANRGWFVIVVEDGTPVLPAPPVPMASGDWIVSTGAIWIHVPLHHAAVIASNVSVTPAIGGWSDVQAAIAGLNTAVGNGLTTVHADQISIWGDGRAATVPTAGSQANTRLQVALIDGGTF